MANTNLQRPSWFDDVPLDVDAGIPAPPMRVSEVLAWRVGTIVSTERPNGENVDVFAGGARLGSGELSIAGSRAVLRMVRFGS